MILALLTTTLPVLPALAAGNLDLKPTEGKIGDSVEVYGYGFNNSTPHDIYFSNQDKAVGALIDTDVTTYKLVKTNVQTDDVEGTLSGYYFTVPDKLTDRSGNDVKVRNGTYYVYMTLGNQKTIVGREQFTVKGAGTITLNTVTGTVGAEVVIGGQGFGNQENITVRYNGNPVNIASGATKTDSVGTFADTKIVVPASPAGQNTITVAGASSGALVDATFTVQPKITLSQQSGATGSTVTVSGTGFGASLTASVTFDNTEVASKNTDSAGAFQVNFTVPSKPAASYDVAAKDGNGNTATSVKFTIAPSTVSVSPATGFPGMDITVSGRGFQINKEVAIAFGNTIITTPNNKPTADSTGNFSIILKVPVVTTGTYKIKAGDGTNTAETDFSVTTGAAINPVTSTDSPGHVGMQVTINGEGFIAGRKATVSYDGQEMATPTVKDDGTFTATLTVPAGKSGEHTITVTDGNNPQTLKFIMEANTPPVPAPLKPEMDIKAESLTFFDWQDVTDPSGVTYTLRVAAKADFSTIVFEKKGLTTSEYTLTRAERLPPVNRDSPYYWHVKAVDGAGNESQWSGAGKYYLGSTFSLPQKAIYILLGAGILLFGIFGFWLGRKTAYY